MMRWAGYEWMKLLWITSSMRVQLLEGCGSVSWGKIFYQIPKQLPKKDKKVIPVCQENCYVFQQCFWPRDYLSYPVVVFLQTLWDQAGPNLNRMLICISLLGHSTIWNSHQIDGPVFWMYDLSTSFSWRTSSSGAVRIPIIFAVFSFSFRRMCLSYVKSIIILMALRTRNTI